MAGAHSPILRVGFLTVRRTGVTRMPARGYNRLAPGERQPVGEAGESDGIAGVSCSARFRFIEWDCNLDSLTAGNKRVNFA